MVGGIVAERSVDSTGEGVGAPGPSDPSALWADFGPPLRAFLVRRVPPGVDADDLLQEVFLRVIKHLGSLRATDRPEAWLFQIARNALRDSLRARQRRDGRTDALETDLPAETDTAAVRESEAELAPCLTPMIDRLPEPYRTAIELTSLRGLGLPEGEVASFENRLKDGGLLLSVQCEDGQWAARARQILEQTGAERVATA